MPPGIISLMPFYALYAYTPVIPAMYWDGKSPEQVIKYLYCEYDKLRHYVDSLAHKSNDTIEAVNTLTELFRKFQESGFDDYYRDQIAQWVRDNMQGIIEQAVKMVFFGLTDDGHFVAYIPDSWAQIRFDTGMNFGSEDYGRLILSYDVAADALPVRQPTTQN